MDDPNMHAYGDHHQDITETILRDVCELEPANPRLNDTICIDISDLKIILDRILALATLPPASAAVDSGAGERESFEAEFPIPEGMVYWDGDKYGVLPDYENSYRADRYCGQWLAWQARAALATKPQAEQEATPPAQTVPHVPEFGLTMFTGYNRTFHETFTIHVDPDMPRDELQFRQGDQVLCRMILDGSARNRGDEVGK